MRIQIRYPFQKIQFPVHIEIMLIIISLIARNGLSENISYEIMFIFHFPRWEIIFIFGMKIATLEVKLIIIYKIILIKAKVKRICSTFTEHKPRKIAPKNKSKEKKNTGEYGGT